MKKKFNFRAKVLGLAIIAASAATAAPAALPQTVAAEESDAQNARAIYTIYRKIHFHYVYDEDTVVDGGVIEYPRQAFGASTSVTFPAIEVASLFKNGLGYWKPEPGTIPSASGSYNAPPAEEHIYMTIDESKYTEETKRITRTIKYSLVDANGKKSSLGSSYGYVDYTRGGYIDDNGNKVMDAWSVRPYTFGEVAVQPRSGYSVNMQKVPARTVTVADSDFEVEVIYSKIPTQIETKDVSRNIKYVYKESGSVFKIVTQTVTLSREYYTDTNGNKVVVRDWDERSFESYNVENVEGYTADMTVVPSAKCSANISPEDVNVYFSANPKSKYTVTFTDGQGNVLKTQQVESGKGATAPANPTRSGYTFAGWDKAFDNVTSSITVNAKWVRKNEPTTETKTVSRKITYYLRDKNGNKSYYGKAEQSADFSRTGYIDGNGNKVMPDWPEQTWDAIDTPVVTGYKPTKAVVPAATFTPDNAPGDETIYLDELPTETQYKTVKRTINFIGKNIDGSTVSLGSAKQSTTLNREVYTDVDGTLKVKRDWNTYTLSEYILPEKNGYTKQQDKVPALKVTGSSNNTSVDVIYNQQKNGFIEEGGNIYYYKDGVKITGTKKINGMNYTFDTAGKLISEPFGLNIGKGSRPFAVISEGWYTISSAKDSSFALDISGGKASDKQNLQIYKSNYSNAQKFYIKPAGNGDYIICTGTNGVNSVLDVAGNKTAVGTNVHQYTSNNSSAQLWKIAANTDGTVTFLAKNSGLALDIAAGKMANKTNVRLYSVNYTKAQSFIITGASAPV